MSFPVSTARGYSVDGVVHLGAIVRYGTSTRGSRQDVLRATRTLRHWFRRLFADRRPDASRGAQAF
jgi:hypothetical protein